MKIKVYLLSFMVFMLLSATGYGQLKSIVVIDTPTAYTLGRGTYQVSFLGYDNGGTEIKTLIGLHDILTFGVSFDIQNFIGKDEPRPNIPGVIARLKIHDGWETLPLSIALGYDSFYIGKDGLRNNDDNELNRMIYGPYVAFTSPIYLFNDEQFVSYGFRLPTQPDYLPNNASYFLALDVPLGDSFRFKTEMERVYWNFRDNGDWLYNVGLRYTYLNKLGVEVDFLFQRNDRPNRIIRIEYYDEI